MRRCGVCGSSEWGSYQENGRWLRVCHGRVSIVGASGALHYFSCPVRWSERDDTEFGVQRFVPDPNAPIRGTRRHLRRVQ